ncbi:MAG: hypothetical protein O7B35_18515, partial [Deltaproteobacteria bacterium]|nr:hypothetical protein [Deltaproteobacteria bacterium]
TGWSLLTEGIQVAVDELATVVRVDSSKGRRELGFNLLDGIQHGEAAPLPMTALRSTQQVAMSTQSRLWANSPAAEAPECDTRSISR